MEEYELALIEEACKDIYLSAQNMNRATLSLRAFLAKNTEKRGCFLKTNKKDLGDYMKSPTAPKTKPKKAIKKTVSEKISKAK